MSANTDYFMTKTSLDYSAEGYWQDFLAQRPIAGGIAYEPQLRACELDESLASLQRIDTLLSQIRRDQLKKASENKSEVNEAELLADERFRHLLLFLAFYAGRVLAKQWQSVAHWYSQSELRRRYPELSFSADDFYQEMAVVYHNSSEPSESMADEKFNQGTSALFFALEPIGLRLFGNIDRQFVAVQSNQVASGLYQAVKERLPDTVKLKAISKSVVPQVANEHKEFVDEPAKLPIDNGLSAGTTQPMLAKNDKNSLAETSTREANADIVNRADKQPTSTRKIIPKQTNKTTQPTSELFTKLLTELAEIEVTQSSGVEEYQQACKILDQFERHIARQAKPREQVKFSETHQAARQQALMLLTDSANKGNTSALLRLAMYQWLGEGLAANDSSAMTSNITNSKTSAEVDKLSKPAGLTLVEQAATAKDSRAQRLLSRLYYQGVGVEQDMAMGKYWLEQAADNGHPEAITINKQWQQAQLLIETQRQEQHSFKRYQWLIGIILIAAILLIIFV